MIPHSSPNLMAKPYKIALWSEDTESWKTLASFASYDEADDNYEKYESKYPGGWVEILDPTC